MAYFQQGVGNIPQRSILTHDAVAASTASVRCSIGLRSGDCGGHWSYSELIVMFKETLVINGYICVNALNLTHLHNVRTLILPKKIILR